MNNNSGDADFPQNWLEDTLAINGELHEFPKVLYKFVSCESKYFPLAAHELLLHSKIRFSGRHEFNDPFDTIIPILTPTNQEAKEYLINLHEKHGKPIPEAEDFERLANPEELLARLDGTFERLGIYSLTANIFSPLMWAHYGCSHRGLAYIFNQSIDYPKFCALPIRYQKNYRKVSWVRGDSVDELSYGSLVKGRDWLYEREWRVIENNKAGQWIDLEPGTIKGVVFGALCSPTDYQFVTDLIARRVASGLSPIDIYMSTLDDDSFELKFKKLVSGKWVDVEVP